MSKKSIIITIVLLFCFTLFKFGCSFGTPVEQMVSRVKQADFVSYELEWLVQQEEKQDFAIINKGGDSVVIKNIKQAMESITPYAKSGWNYIWLKPIGVLKLKAFNGSEERIDITEGCFFTGAERQETSAFYSKELSGIIKEMFYKAQEEYSLLTTEDLFDVLSKGGALKYLAQPEGKRIFVERMKQRDVGKRSNL